jgi:NADH-quinone oxidoreductase subunit C
MSGLGFAAIAEQVCATYPGVTVRESENGQFSLLVPASLIGKLCTFLKHDPTFAFDGLMDLTAYDRLKYPSTPPGTDIAVVYLLFSYSLRHKLMLEVWAPREACTVPTASDVWPAAIYFEREVYDLYGVQFTGHPSLERIMCPSDWIGHPLRKDYVYPAEYHGVPHLRRGQHFESAPARVGDAPVAAKAEKKEETV